MASNFWTTTTYHIYMSKTSICSLLRKCIQLRNHLLVWVWGCQLQVWLCSKLIPSVQQRHLMIKRLQHLNEDHQPFNKTNFSVLFFLFFFLSFDESSVYRFLECLITETIKEDIQQQGSNFPSVLPGKIDFIDFEKGYDRLCRMSRTRRRVNETCERKLW